MCSLIHLILVMLLSEQLISNQLFIIYIDTVNYLNYNSINEFNLTCFSELFSECTDLLIKIEVE